jgi:protein gp37
MTGDLPLSPLRPASFPVPAIIADAGERASEHFLEFFAATIRNKNTRAAYVQAVAQFCRWCEQHQLQLATIRPLHMSAYIENMPRRRNLWVATSVNEPRRRRTGGTCRR